MNDINSNNKTLDQEVIKLFKDNRLSHLVIIVLYHGDVLPQHCTAMLRNPRPKENITLKNNLSEIYFSAIEKNSSVEDGAIMIREKLDQTMITGFSYRIFAPPLDIPRLENKGSGYNSALDYSGIENVICVYLVNKKDVKKFIMGQETILSRKV